MPMKKKILIVDDSIVNRSILTKILRDDYRIIQAENGKEALERLEECQQKISLILLDIVMPVMNGYEFLEAVKKSTRWSKVPVIVSTQEDGASDEVKALSSGAADFLTKPYKAQVIRHRVANIIRMNENKTIIDMVERDKLTGLLSKEFFYLEVQNILTQHPDKKYDIVCSDIEKFKLINDMFGIATGDELLIYYTNILQEQVGDHGIYGRLGADTFAILLEHREAYSSEIFEKNIKKLNEFPITVSLNVRYGIYAVDDPSLQVSVMCDRALLAASSIKGHYGTVYKLYDDKIRQSLIREQYLLSNMETALSEEQFVVYYQPKYNLQNEKMSGAEALVRWIHPTNGFLSPGEFIPLFEKNGFIAKLDYYVWDKVCRKIRDWEDHGYAIPPISVNVSRADIYMQDLVKTLTELLEKYQVSPMQLHLEITETAYTDNPEQIISVVQELKRRGFIIEMDDFGKGYSSLNMLSELPIDILKLDMSFIQNESKKDGNKNILSFIISLAKWMNLQVIAEGVETKEQVEQLRNMECNYVQGYYFAKPMPESNLEVLLQNSSFNYEDMEFESNSYGLEIEVKSHSREKREIVVVDDVNIHRQIISEIFAPYFTIVEANNGMAAMTYIRENAGKIAVVLLDLVMPVLDGFQVLERMKSDEELKDIPVIVTSQSRDNSEEWALSLGADDFIEKPYNKKVLMHHVRNAILLAEYKKQKKKN